jgi:hypothetical protein
MNNVHFTCTALAGKNKVGNIPVDKDGYYDMVVGGLNIFNSAGQWYTYEGAKDLFQNSSSFQRRVQRGSLKGEVGHPRQEQGQSDDAYVARVMDIRETNVCVQFKEIYLDFDRMKDTSGRPVVAIMAKLIPSGPHGAMLQKSLDNKNENVCFSIRSFTKDYYNKGVYSRDIKHIVTFDYVGECGISIANKYDNPGLENFSDKIVTENQIKRIIENSKTSNIATESSVGLARDLLSSMGWNLPAGVTPAFSKW